MELRVKHLISSLFVLLDLLIESLLLFMIIFKTPKAMTRFKVYLALLCVNSLSMSVCMGFLWQPDFLAPPLCVYRNGFFSSLVSNRVMIASVGALAMQQVQMLLLSYYFAFSQTNYNVSLRVTFGRIASEIIFVAVPTVSMFVLMFYGESSSSYVQNHTIYSYRDYPNMACYFIGDFHAGGTVNYAIVLSASVAVFFVFSAGFLLVQIRRRLRNPPSYMSPYTLQLHRMFFMNVVVQSISPLLCVFFPVLSSLGYMAIAKHPLAALFFQFVPISSMFNSVVSSLLIIYLTKPYREYVLSRFKSWKVKISELSSSH